MASYASTAFGYMDKNSSYNSKATSQKEYNNFEKALSNLANLTIEQTNRANELTAAAAMYATNMSMAEAARNRTWQEGIYAQQQAYNSAEAQTNRNWQEQMSNTSYQRAVKDMKAAGINPILAYQQGGASTPGGSTAQIGTVSSGLGSAYSYQAQAANMNNAIVTMGTLAMTALELFGDAFKDLIPEINKKRGTIASRWKGKGTGEYSKYTVSRDQ